ncbi:hypothetical protein SAMN04488093_10638 [Tropicibacter naphthalenivorans]|uniref:Uncharacterized protein n=2 Tax=Tropicibacter naphthalenivorans TaxID=441103 RepID=A0A0P1GFR4_9RHOB|nr:hypothetical protein TRN7648_03067 [Tropicibacter naphthalenivorans]SMC89131.1 hypothetical protein SAMN04488093_10638 [Tropicibacter naphthalenivorans]
MVPCADCPDAHHQAADGTVPDCHHVMSLTLAPLSPMTGLVTPSFGRAVHGLPSAETGSHRAPEHDLPPPRA